MMILMVFDICEKASKYYLEDRYPPVRFVEYEYEEIVDLTGGNLIGKIRKRQVFEKLQIMDMDKGGD